MRCHGRPTGSSDVAILYSEVGMRTVLFSWRKQAISLKAQPGDLSEMGIWTKPLRGGRLRVSEWKGHWSLQTGEA